MGPSGHQFAMEQSQQARDLESELKPSLQCKKAANKAWCALPHTERAVGSRRPEVRLALFKAFVRPRLEYSFQAWRPCTIKDMKMLDQVRRVYARCFGHLRHMGYEYRLRICFERGRERSDLIRDFKVVYGLSAVQGKVEAICKRRVNETLGGHG